MIVRGLALLLALALCLIGIQSLRLGAANEQLAALKRAHAAERDALQVAAGAAQSDYRMIERAMSKAVQEAQDAGRKERDRLVRAGAADRDERERLRDELARVAAGGGSAADDSLEACRARAAELGRAVDAGLRVQADMATRFGDLAIDYRTLYLAWPKASAP